jgi:hypothetical protein
VANYPAGLLYLRSHPPTIRLPARLPCPSRFVSTAASLCTALLLSREELNLSKWHALLFAAFGGIFGVILTLAVTEWRDRAKKREERRSRLRWLLAEIIDNLAHINRYSLAGGRAKVQLLTQAWETVKGDTLDLNPDITNSLRAAYAEVWRFNSIVEYDLRVPPGHGSLDGSLEAKAAEVKTVLSDSHSKLAGHLGVSARSAS